MKTDLFRQKMEAANVNEAAIRAFESGYEKFAREETGLIAEGSITAVDQLPSLESLPKVEAADVDDLLDRSAILKLNGGLGTSMGLDRAKSLLPVKAGKTFLDLIVAQVLYARQTAPGLRFFLMNSFSTSADTRQALAKYPELGDPDAIELMQNKVPKVDAESLEPVSWPENPDLEWCPPGHGDLYAALAGSNTIDRLLEEGIEYLFVSNSDNLGASLDPTLLRWFADSQAPFAMEVTARTPSDRKGGHLALQDGRFILRESAQCPDEDMDAFQDISVHRFFNTNNLWLRLSRLREALNDAGGYLPLPVICNRKTVDPRDKTSTPVVQLETAMGAAIGAFPDAVAIEVPRSRFAPVKTTGDLLALRSDAYAILEDGTVQLAESRNGLPPKIDLDDNYKMVDWLDRATSEAVPSLINCRSLKLSGPLSFDNDVEVIGDVAFINDCSTRIEIPGGTYQDTRWTADGYDP